jgi:arylsulfatase A-like enzyme
MGKQSNYEHSVHVPLIFSGPGVPAGEDRDSLCYLLDIYPTLCDLLGLDTPSSVDGRSLHPLLAGDTSGRRDTLHFAYRHLHRGVRDERYKLIEYAVDGRRTTQLFDLLEDPHELANLAGNPGSRPHLARLRQDLQKWRTEHDDSGKQGQVFWAAYDEAGGDK